jgi:probable F420-dependent oxidoreductase
MFPLLEAATSKLFLYPNVAIAFPRSPMHLAYPAWDLQRATEGRFALGIGSQIRPPIEKRYGARWDRPVRQMRQYVEALKAIFATWQDGAALDFHGDYHTLSLMTPMFLPGHLQWGPPPVWVGGLGPMMTRVAAEVADGSPMRCSRRCVSWEPRPRPPACLMPATERSPTGSPSASRTILRPDWWRSYWAKSEDDIKKREKRGDWG